MSEKLFGIDLSYSVLTPTKMAQLKARGVEVVGQCLWTGAEQPAPRITNLRIADQAGVMIFGYFAINASRPGRWHFERARDGVPSDLWNKLVLLPVDVELPGIQLSEVLEAGRATEEERFHPTLYTSNNVWHNYVTPANSAILSRLDWWLWNAVWDADEDIDFLRFPYGGWTLGQLVGEQWSGGVDLETVHVDRNVFIHEKIINGRRPMLPPIPPPTPPPTVQWRPEWQLASSFFQTAAAKALRGERLTLNEADRIRFLMAGA